MKIVENICQVILHVKDMNEMVSFYRDILDLKIKDEYVSEDYSNSYWMEFDLGQIALCLHAGGNGEFSEASPRFTFLVKDIEESRNHLLSNGVNMSEIRSNDPDQKTRVSDGKDPEGFIFSIEQFL
jgi:catechol 2,3-dioxygenase-like lactoylglutathione lyase family enzyme